MSAARRLLLLAGVLLLAACATPAPPLGGPSEHRWSGRLALQIETDPPQHFSAAFELSGQASAGELRLISPLGQVLGTARWTPRGAWLQRGREELPYANMDELTTAVTGTALPLEPLFQWLRGEPAALGGWQADLSRHADGRLQARRLQPEPAVQLRLVLY